MAVAEVLAQLEVVAGTQQVVLPLEVAQLEGSEFPLLDLLEAIPHITLPAELLLLEPLQVAALPLEGLLDHKEFPVLPLYQEVLDPLDDGEISF